MLKKSMFLLVLLFQVGEVNAGAKFFYGILVDGVPYIFLDDEERVARVKDALIMGHLETSTERSHLQLSSHPDSSMIFFTFKEPNGSYTWDYKLWKVNGKAGTLGGLYYFNPGSPIWIQLIEKDNSGESFKLTIDGYFYDSKGSIVIRCKPIDPGVSIQPIEERPITFNVIASSQRYLYAPRMRLFDNPPLPQLHQSILDTLSARAIKDTLKRGHVYAKPRYSHQRFVVKNRQNADTLYALMCSYDYELNDSRGTLIVLDKCGVELYRSEKIGYYQIHGISDVDGEETHELILRNGSEWMELRYELLVPEYYREIKKLEFKSHFNKSPPNFQPPSC